MKRFVLSVFLLFAGLSIFAQSYDDWNKLFTEYKGGTAESRLRYIGSLLPYDTERKEMSYIFALYTMKNEMKDNASLDDKLYYNQCFDFANDLFPNIKKNTEIFISFLSKNKLNIYNISDLYKYDLRGEFKEISGRELELQPRKFRNEKVCLEARYDKTANGYALFEFYDEVDSVFKTLCAEYTDEAAEQLLNIKKSDVYSNNYYILYGTVENNNFVLEFMEHR